MTAPPPLTLPVSLRQATLVWARIALLSFGGPAGQIALMHRVLVDERRWLGEGRFLHALNYCMLLPGPEAQQLATYIGWLMHGVRGGLIAGGLFILPGAVAIMALSWLYAGLGAVPVVQALFFGLKAAVIAIIVDALVRIGRRALTNVVLRGVAAAAFLALFVFHIPFPLVVLAAGLAGYGGGRLGLAALRPGIGHDPSGTGLADRDTVLGEILPAHARPTRGWSLRVGLLCLALWLGPVAALVLVLGPGNVFAQIALFFSQMAVVTFGGAYAVLSYVAQQAVEHFGWLRPGEMLDGLALAETTPGPLIMVTQFVGFLAGSRAPGGLPPLVAGTLGGLLTTWVTFVPCFLWIFLGAPHVERLRRHRALSAALAAITAAVVGVILNLGLWFALHALFSDQLRRAGIDLPVLSSVDWPAALLTLAAVLAVFRLKWGVLPVLGFCAVAGIALHLAGVTG